MCSRQVKPKQHKAHSENKGCLTLQTGKDKELRKRVGYYRRDLATSKDPVFIPTYPTGLCFHW